MSPINPFHVPNLDEAAQYEQALELLGSAHKAADICALTGLPGDTVRGICADPRGTRAAILRARAPKPEPTVKVSERAAVDVAQRKTVAPPRRVALGGDIRPGRILDSAAGDYYPPPVRGVPEPPRTADDVNAPDTTPTAPSITLPGSSVVHLPSQTVRVLLERTSRVGILLADIIADLQKALADAAVTEREPVVTARPEPAEAQPAPRKRKFSDESRARMRAGALIRRHKEGRHTIPAEGCPTCASATPEPLPTAPAPAVVPAKVQLDDTAEIEARLRRGEPAQHIAADLILPIGDVLAVLERVRASA